MINALNAAVSLVDVLADIVQEHLTAIACIAILGSPVAAIAAGYIL